MPYEIEFENVPAGVCVEAVHKGDTVKIQTMEFVTDEDGDRLISRLESFGSDILARLPVSPPVQPWQVRHLLAIIRRDRTATVYLNELKELGLFQVKRDDIKQGEAVFADDIADVHRWEFEGVTIPKDAGIIYVFSIGWRRAVFYDLRPASGPDPQEREYDVPIQLARLYAYLMFQGRFRITDQEWRTLFDGQWFPFTLLKEPTIRNLISYATNGWPLDDLVEVIAQEVSAALPGRLAIWKRAAVFGDHVTFLETAAERYLARDFVSTTAILYPRIEGLLRSQQKLTDPNRKASQKALAESAISKVESERHAATLLLPTRFREYLETVYFAAFDPDSPKIKVSRNSVGHGVASGTECSLKSATISLLLVDQLWYCFSGASVKACKLPGE